MANILLIEPDRQLASTYAHALTQAAHTVQVSATAQDAIQSADETQPDLVLLELQLVAHGGVEFLYEFRSYADWQNIPVVILSYVPPGEFHKSASTLTKQLGVSAYCYKPRTSLKKLLQTVEGVLQVA